MLTVLSGEHYNYNELVASYLDFFSSKGFENFLNTTQTGYAHSSSGTDLSLLLKTILTSLFLCTTQFSMFCLFRNIFKSLYQPRCFCVPLTERIMPLEKGFLNWIMPTLSQDILYYLSLGLDTYFFVRYIHVLLLFFLGVGMLNMLVLIPVNICGSSPQYSAHGLDKLSLSNISAEKVEFLNAHFIMGLLTVILFHWLLIYELNSVVKIKQGFLLSQVHRNSMIGRTLLVKNVPNELLTIEKLSNFFSIFNGGVQKIWIVDDYLKIESGIRQAEYAINVLELAEIKFIKNYHQKVGNNRLKRFTKRKSLSPSFYPPIKISFVIPVIHYVIDVRMTGILRVFMFQKPVDQREWAIKQLMEAKDSIESQKLDAANGKLEKHNSVFVLFNNQAAAYTAHQVLLSESQGYMDKTVTEVHPRDVVWFNLVRKNRALSLAQRYVVTIMCIILIILYTIPVSFIGSFSQLPLLTHLLPFLKWIYKLPEEARDCISSILPSILLTTLSYVMLVTFRYLTQFKGKMTGAGTELDMQKWYFGFLFFQQFLVVTILSSITVILKQILDQPTSIPVMLATNLPKSATFFFYFIGVKALGFCGNNFLRVDQLILRNTFYRLTDRTPRQKLKRLTTLLKVKWGNIYPIYTFYATIGLTFTIISPLIALFIIIILFLGLLYYKYSLRFIYSHINESETYGKLYPLALLHLYTGIYCLECCLTGVFFLLEDSKHNFPMRVHGWCMTLILIATIFGHITIYKRYSRYFYNHPVIVGEEKEEDTIESPPSALASNYEMLYLNPSFKYEIPKIWLPTDDLGIASEEVEKLQNEENIAGVVTEGSTISFSQGNWFLYMTITDAPPDYK